MPRNQQGLVKQLQREGMHPRVVDAFRKIAREDFVPPDARNEAYRDRPILIPERQTTSQPSLIARMLDVAEPKMGDRALEIGTGFGFQTALLALLVAEVVSIERFASLAKAATDNLIRSSIENVEVVVGDGWEGWPERAPYDVIIVSAGATDLPPALAAQLAEGGRMVIPLTRAMGEEVVLFVKRDGELERVKLVTPARFVPLIPGNPA